MSARCDRSIPKGVLGKGWRCGLRVCGEGESGVEADETRTSVRGQQGQRLRTTHPARGGNPLKQRGTASAVDIKPPPCASSSDSGLLEVGRCTAGTLQAGVKGGGELAFDARELSALTRSGWPDKAGDHVQARVGLVDDHDLSDDRARVCPVRSERELGPARRMSYAP